MQRRLVPFAALVLGFGALGQLARGAQEPLTDQQFVTRALAKGIVEEKLAEHAAKDGQSAKVRAYAQHLVTDHTKANKQLMAVAAEMKLGVVAGLDKDSKELQDRFSRLKGADLDRAFVNHMVDAHQRDIRMYESVGKSATNAVLRTYVTATLPTLRKHLEEARKLADDLKNPK